MQDAPARVGPYAKLAVETTNRLAEITRNEIPRAAH